MEQIAVLKGKVRELQQLIADIIDPMQTDPVELQDRIDEALEGYLDEDS